MKWKKTKTAALLLACSLAIAIFPSRSLAADDYCQVLVGDDQCGKHLAWDYKDRTIAKQESHKYGGFLGIGAKTCTYDYYYLNYVYKCGRGHIADTKAVRRETGHTCGQ